MQQTKKCIILTGYQPTKEEKYYIKNFCKNIFKIALNHHAEDCEPDIRIITDYVAEKIWHDYPEPILSIRDEWNLSDRVKHPSYIKFRGATILAAIDYAKYKGYDNILLVADNTVYNKEFQQLVKNSITNDGTIYQCSCGNFNLPVKRIIPWILS